MGSMSIWHWVIVLVIVILLFGRGRLSDVMGDFAKGIKSFKKGMADDDAPPAAPPRELAHDRREPAPTAPVGADEARRP